MDEAEHERSIQHLRGLDGANARRRAEILASALPHPEIRELRL